MEEIKEEQKEKGKNGKKKGGRKINLKSILFCNSALWDFIID
jgi:hypothetical protein